MDAAINNQWGETAAHTRLKRLACVWAQAQGYSACATEVRLLKCRYRADVAAYRPETNGSGSTAIFECKQALPDLRRDNCDIAATQERLETICRRRQILEKHLRIHFPNLRIADSLFPEFDSHDFAAIQHRGYTRVLRELTTLQNRLYDCTKFDKLILYRCANLFFLVLPSDLFRDSEIPIGWGVLVESDGDLALVRKPIRQQSSPDIQLGLLHRIATAATRLLNKHHQITFDDVLAVRCRGLTP
jgi:hypothetical protein